MKRNEAVDLAYDMAHASSIIAHDIENENDSHALNYLKTLQNQLNTVKKYCNDSADVSDSKILDSIEDVFYKDVTQTEPGVSVDKARLDMIKWFIDIRKKNKNDSKEDN